MKQLLIGICACLFAASTLAADGAPKMPKPDKDGAISTKQYLDYLEVDLKPKVFSGAKVLECYKLKFGKTFDKKYREVAKSCKARVAKQVPPKIRGQFEMQRVEGPFMSCLHVTMRDRQKLTEKEVYECVHREEG